MPFSTSVNRVFISRVGVPRMTVRVMSVVPSWYWAPEVDQQDAVSFQLAAGLVGDAVMGERCIGAGAGDRRERKILERARFLADLCGHLRYGDLVRLLLERGRLEPAEKTHHRGAVAAVGGAGTLLFNAVLARFGQDARVGSLDDLGTPKLEQGAQAFGHRVRVDEHSGFSRSERCQCFLEIARLTDGCDLRQVIGTVTR